MFSLEDRFRGNIQKRTVTVITYEGLTIDLCHRIKADFILRGLRNPADFEFEKPSHTNRRLSKIETVFLLTAAKPRYREGRYRNGGEYQMLVKR
jgi:pantetheine-phosphate adenylyltransferase